MSLNKKKVLCHPTFFQTKIVLSQLVMHVNYIAPTIVFSNDVGTRNIPGTSIVVVVFPLCLIWLPVFCISTTLIKNETRHFYCTCYRPQQYQPLYNLIGEPGAITLLFQKCFWKKAVAVLYNKFKNVLCT
jgi:hypothetical protein